MARAAAWSVPVIAVAPAAPAFAASPCTFSWPNGSGWTTVASGSPKTGSTLPGWRPGGQSFWAYLDGSTAGNGIHTSTSPTVQWDVGRTYYFTVTIKWGYGNGSAGASVGAEFRIRMGGTTVLDLTTRTEAVGSTPGTRTYSFSYTPTQPTGTIEYRAVAYRTQSSGRTGSDDWEVSNPVVTNGC